jgi:hypothetical protein
MATGSRTVFLKRLHEMEKQQAQRHKGQNLSSTETRHLDDFATASGGYPNIGYDESSDDENYDETVEENDITLNLDDDERKSSRRKAEQWLRECEEADDISPESSVPTPSVPTPARVRRSRGRSDGLQTNGKKYLKTEPGLARKLYPTQPHGARKTSWMNIFKRIQSTKVAYRLNSFLSNDADMKPHDDHHQHDPYKKKGPLKRKKTKKLKNMTKQERRIYFKHRGKILICKESDRISLAAKKKKVEETYAISILMYCYRIGCR